jgi:hypothetical protein
MDAGSGGAGGAAAPPGGERLNVKSKNPRGNK